MKKIRKIAAWTLILISATAVASVAFLANLVGSEGVLAVWQILTTAP